MVARTTSSGGKSIVGAARRALVDLAEEQLGAAAAGFEELLVDRREADVIGCLDVVVADDRQVARHVQAELVGRREDPERLRVARGEDRGRRSGPAQESDREFARLVPSVGAERDRMLGEG